MAVLYSTTAVNRSGISGLVEIINPENFSWEISSPMNTQSGTNPEQLLAASVATCLHASLKYVLAREKKVIESFVETQVDLLSDEVGYQFAVLATIHFSTVSVDEARMWVEMARQQCPLAKLIPSLQIIIEVEEDR